LGEQSLTFSTCLCGSLSLRNALQMTLSYVHQTLLNSCKCLYTLVLCCQCNKNILSITLFYYLIPYTVHKENPLINILGEKVVVSAGFPIDFVLILRYEPQIVDYKNVVAVWFQRSNIVTQRSLVCKFVKYILYKEYILCIN